MTNILKYKYGGNFFELKKEEFNLSGCQNNSNYSKDQDH